MDRRYFVMKGLGAVTVGLKLSTALASAKSCKIIGIGSAGCNFVLASSRSGGVLDTPHIKPEFICISFDSDMLVEVSAANRSQSDRAPVKNLALSAKGSTAEKVVRARAAALQNRDALTALLADTKLVFLVAGLGGGAGSGVTPVMARLAREAGALAVAAVLTPFDFEGDARTEAANDATRSLRREADLVMNFSNQELMDVTGDSITQSEFFEHQNRRIAVCLLGLMGAE